MICFLRPHLLCFSHSSRWLAQGREKETERAEGRPGRARRYLPRPHVSLTVQTEVGQEGASEAVWGGGGDVDGRQSASITHTRTHMHGHKQSVGDGWVRLCDRQAGERPAGDVA